MVVASSLTLAATSAQAADGGSAGTTGTSEYPTPGASTHRITLVTGDVAELTTNSGGQVSARLTSDEPYYFGNFDGDLTLVPASAYPLLTAGRLDQRLFNLTDLVAQGYDDASSDKLPLLLTAPSTLRSTPSAPQAATLRRTLPSVGSTAVSVQKSDAKTFWDGVSGPTTFKSSQLTKIWLDGTVTHATLDSAPEQIGAPTAWQPATTARGVKVAVLDTGIDTDHPDLADGLAAENFIRRPSRSRTATVTAPTSRRPSPARRRVRRQAQGRRAGRRTADRQGARQQRQRPGLPGRSPAWSGPRRRARR